MNCPKCSSVLVEGSKFCKQCGTKIEVQEEVTKKETLMQQPTSTKQKKPLDKRIIVAIVAAVFLVIVCVICVATHKHKIDLNEYVKVEFEGYETLGTAKVIFDYDEFFDELNEYADVSRKDIKEIEEELDEGGDDLSELGASLAELAACEDMEWKLSKNSELKNGDKITLSFTYNNEVAKKYGIKFEGKETEYTVKGLKEVEIIDAFADINVTFSGVSPNASVTIENNSSKEVVKNQYFSADKSSGIKKGDKVVVSVNVDENNLLTQYGCKFKETSKEYTCEEVDEYVTDGSQLTEEILSSMKDQTKDVIDAYLANNKTNIKGSNVKYVGYYFLTQKDESQSSWGDNNIVYIVYSVKVSSKDKQFKASTVYMPVKFSNIIKYVDGTEFVDLNRTDILGTTDLNFGWWNSVEGYKKESDMKNELVTSQKSTYGAASFEGLK